MLSQLVKHLNSTWVLEYIRGFLKHKIPTLKGFIQTFYIEGNLWLLQFSLFMETGAHRYHYWQKIGLEKYWHAIVFDTQFRPHEEWPVLLWEVHFTIGHCTKEVWLIVYSLPDCPSSWLLEHCRVLALGSLCRRGPGCFPTQTPRWTLEQDWCHPSLITWPPHGHLRRCELFDVLPPRERQEG